MLANWYFCCCIGMSEEETNTFLAILEIINNDKEDDALVFLAYSELCRTESWMQIYAFPQVLRSLHRIPVTNDVQKMLERYLGELLQLLPDKEMQDAFESLTSFILMVDGSSEMIQAMKTCSQTVGRLPFRTRTEKPYLDLKTFLPETLLLATLFDQFTCNPNFASALSNSMEMGSEMADIEILIENALRYQFGRLAFLLAARLAPLLLQKYDCFAIAKKLWSVPDGAAEVEPDLIETSACTLYLDRSMQMNDDANRSKRFTHTMINETFSLWQWRLLQASKRKTSEENRRAALRRLNLLTTEHIEALPIILWQVTLWELAAQIDPRTTAERLFAHWIAPETLPNVIAPVEISGQYPQEEGNRWAANLRLLYSLQTNKTIDITFRWGTQPPFGSQISGFRSSWLFFSPWLHINKLSFTQKEEERYPTASNDVILIRLLASTKTAIHLLRMLPLDHYLRKRFAALVAHTHDVLDSSYHTWLTQYKSLKPDGKVRRLSKEMTGLALFCNAEIQRVGRAKLENVPPETFLSLLPGRMRDVSAEMELFQRMVLSEVLISWIEDAYLSITGLRESNPWLALIGEVYEAHRRDPRHAFPKRILAALIMRFLTEGFEAPTELDWRRAKHKNAWAIGHRQLLLSPDLSADEWQQRPDWHEPDWEDPNLDNRLIPMRLVRAIQRLAALMEDDETIDEQTKNDWFKEWRSCMNGLSKSRELDRFVRLRLLELLDKPALVNLYDDQELIAMTILEYGTVYDLQKLVDQIYWPPTQGNGEMQFAPVNETRRDLGQAVLKTIYQRANKTGDEIHRNARNPYIVRFELEKRSFFLHTLLQIAYISRLQAQSADASELRKMLTNLHRQSLRDMLHQPTSLVQSEAVEQYGKNKYIILPDDTRVKDWMLRGAVYDPNMLKYVLFYEKFNLNGVLNLFEASSDEVDRFLDARSNDPVKLLGAVVEERQLRQGNSEFVINCGLPFYFSKVISKPLPEGYAIPYIGINIYWDAKLQKFSVHGDIEALKQLPLPGDITTVALRESWREQFQKRRLSLKYQGDEYYDAADLRLWDADTSRLFCEFASDQQYRAVFVKVDEAGGVKPVEFNLLRLLLDGHSYIQGQVFVLTLIEESGVDTQTGDRSWLFSTRPGENYRLYRSDFLPDDLVELEREIHKVDDAFGLLVVVEPTFDEQRKTICLRLAREQSGDQVLEKFYPELMTPFDWRNYRWHMLFNDLENPYAVREHDGKRWFLDLEKFHPIPGYPHKIQVIWKKYTPSPGASVSSLVSPEWNEENWRKSYQSLSVTADCEYMLEIEPQERNWQSFLDRWIALRNGDHVKIERVINTIDAGGDDLLTCVTDERIAVSVEAESLTMQPLTIQHPIDMEEKRDAEIYRCFWRRVDIEAEIEDITQIPPAALVENTSLGILVKVPPRRSQSTNCSIFWQTSHGWKRQDLIIANFGLLAKAYVGLGSKIIGERTNEGWHFRFHTRLISARALWTVTEWKRRWHEGLTYLGMLSYQGNMVPVAELRPGELVIVPQQPKNAFHLAEIHEDRTGNIVVSKEKVQPTTKLRNKTRPNSSQENNRMVLMQKDKLLIGVCQRKTLKPWLTLSAVRLKLLWQKNNLLSFQREFDLRITIQEVATHTREETDLEVLKRRLWDYFKAPYNLKGMMRANQCIELDDMQVPLDTSFSRWGSLVPLANEKSPFVSDAAYSSEAEVRLLEEADGRIIASLLHVPPCTPEQYRTLLGGIFNHPIILEKDHDPLYYVGPENADPITAIEYEEPCHRFEWGPGQTLLVSERKLRLNGSPFRSSNLLLYHGDIITAITFQPDESAFEEREQDEVIPCIIAINDYDIQFSQVHSLFVQRRDYKIVHILHLTLDQNEVRVDFIEGFDERSETETYRYRKVRGVVRLSQESQHRLLSRKRPNDDGGERSLNILGRLDIGSFEATLGREVFFEHVRFSFEDHENGPGLKRDELVFVQAGRIFERWNDMALSIQPPPELPDEDKGTDMHKLVVLRRQFSVREDLLHRIYKADNGKGYYLAGLILLVKLRSPERGSIVDSIPSRKTRALKFGDRNTILLAAWVNSFRGLRGEEFIQIELKPGIFVILPGAQLTSYPRNVDAGAIVRIESRGNNHFSITQATFGDERYVPSSTRLAVTLPKNDLLKPQLWEENDVESNRFWRDKRSFTIGGLPNIVASPGTYNVLRSSWNVPTAGDFIKLMETRHPKIVRLGKDGTLNRIAPASPDVLVGRLVPVANSLEVTYESLMQQDGSHSAHELLWCYLSFGDEAIEQILERIKHESWYYHDAETGYWSEQGVELINLNAHTAWTGPLFFQKIEDDMCLRYSKEFFLSHGFPVDELIYSLKRRPGAKTTYPVAGVSEDGGLWLELSPGRIIELPAQLVARRVKGREKPLAALNWEGFAAGDKVSLSVASGDPLTIDRIFLEDWIPGPRAAFGDKRCFLPVQSCDLQRGALNLGSGEFALTLPVEFFDQGCQAAVLYPDNQIETDNLAQDFKLETDDVVLLGLDEADTPIVLGMPGLIPLQNLHAFAQWENDPLGLVDQKDNRYFNVPNRLKEIIRAVGGAFPVTVDRVLLDNRVLFSRRVQQRAASIPPGRLATARVLGRLNGGGKVMALLRVGSGIITMPVNKIISGLPQSHSKIAIETLKKEQITIWLRRTDEGELVTGLDEEGGVQIMMDALDMIELEDSQGAGLICQSINSLRLYWLPAQRASWIPLSAQQLRRVLIEAEDKQPFKARLKDNYRSTPGISIIDVQEVRKELRDLEIGRELHVRILEEVGVVEDTHSYLAENFSTRTILQCEIYDNEVLMPGDELAVEVIQRTFDKQPAILVAPLGKKRQKLDLPHWMFGDWHSDIDPYTQHLQEHERWLFDIPLDLSTFYNVDLLVASNSLIDELLCYAFAADSKIHMQFQAQVAYQWFQRHLQDQEISVAFAIMTILLLDRFNREREVGFAKHLPKSSTRYDEVELGFGLKALELMRSLGRRAMRSIHIEIISYLWLCHENRENHDGLWKRLQLFKDYLLPNLRSEQITDIRQFYQAVQLRNRFGQLTAISEALAAATGQSVNVVDLTGIYSKPRTMGIEGSNARTRVVKELIEIYQTLPEVKSSVPYIHRTHIEKLRGILQWIKAQKFDVILLDPLPRLKFQADEKNQ